MKSALVDVTFHLIAVSLLRVARSRIRIAAITPNAWDASEVYSIRNVGFLNSSFQVSFPCILVGLRRLDMRRLAVLLQRKILLVAVIRTVIVQPDVV